MSNKKKDHYSIGSLLRSRGIEPNTDITDLWASQKKNRSGGDEKKSATKINGKVAKPKRSGTLKKRRVSSRKKVSNFKRPLFSKRLSRKNVLVFLVILVAGVVLKTIVFSTTKPTTDRLGTSVTTNQPEVKDEQIFAVTNTEFELLWPGNSSASDYEVVKVSPPDNDTVYAYIDIFNDVELRVSQQEIPTDFEGNVAEKVRDIATSFQATEVIQINDDKIYHGFSDKQGEVQSLIFEKNDLLIFIASPVKFSDDIWAGYILNLN